MKSVRNSVFETNSSSTHSLTICTRKDFNDFVEGKKYLGIYDNTLYDELPTDQEFFYRGGYADSLEEAMDIYCDLEYYEEGFVTPSGDAMVAFGWYGHD